MSTTPLPIDQFAKKVRDKYPGAYDHLSDAELVGKVVNKYPQYKDNIASYATTQFEKDRSGEGPNSGFLSGVQSSIGNASAPATAGQAVKEGVLAGLPGVGLAKSLYDTAKNAPANYKAGGVAGVAGPLVGIDPVSMRARAEVGDTGGILGEAAIPTAAALAAPVMQGVGAVKGAAGRALIDSTGRPNPIPRLILGNERAQALGEVMNPDIADARVAAKAKMDALSAGRTAPGPWRPGIKPTPELGSPANPGLFAPIPTTMPKPAYTPLVDSPNFNINKEKALTGQSVPISQSPYYNVNQDLLKPQKPVPPNPFAGMTASNTPIGNAQVPPPGTYPLPKLVATPPEPVGIPSDEGVSGSVPRPSGRLVVLPQEAQALDQMQRIAKMRASQHGMQYAAGMRPAGGGRVPMSPTPTMTTEYPGARQEVLQGNPTPFAPPATPQFKGGINQKGVEASSIQMSPEDTMTSLSTEIGRMNTSLRNSAGRPAAERAALQNQIKEYQQRLDEIRGSAQ